MSQQKHTTEFESCIEQVMEQGHDKGSAFAICTDSFKKAGKPIFVGESEKQKLHLFCESFKLEGNRVSGVAIHPKRLFHPEEGMTHVYLKEELEKASTSLAGKPFGIDHIYVLPPPNIVTKSWYCPEHEGVCFEGLVDDHIAEKIRKKAFKGISIELDWLRPGGSVHYVNGVAAKNFELTSLHLLTKFPPADVDAFIKLWNSIKEQLVVAPAKPLDEEVAELKTSFEAFQNAVNERFAKIEGQLSALIPQSPSPIVSAQTETSKVIGGKKMSEQNQNQEPEKDEHGCIIGKERYDEETEKCVAITAEARASFLEAKLRLREQEGELTVEEIKAKIAELTKQKAELDAKLYPESELSEDEKTAVRAQMDILWAEIDAYEQALAAKIAGQAAPPQTSPTETDLQKIRETIVTLRKRLVETEAALATIEKQKKRETASWKERYETLREAVKAAIPVNRVWRSWSAGPQRYVQEHLKILREIDS